MELGKFLTSGTNTEALTPRWPTTWQRFKKTHFYLTTFLPCTCLFHCPGTRQEQRQHHHQGEDMSSATPTSCQ